MSRPEHLLVIGPYIFACAFLQGVTTHAATYYVATTGNDATTCAQAKTQSTPKQTIPAGVKCLAGGDTLIVKAGTYINQEIFNPPAGTASAYTVITSDPAGPRPVIRPNPSFQRGLYCTGGDACRYIEWRHFEVDGGYEYMKLHGSDALGYPHHLKIIDNVFHDSKNSGFLIGSSITGFIGGDHLISGNEFYNSGIGTPHYKPGMNTIYNPGNRTIVENNVFHNGANGVGIWRATGAEEIPHDIHNVIIRNNIFYDWARTTVDTWQSGATGYNGVHVSVPGGGHRIYNNVFYRSCDVSICRFVSIKMRGPSARVAVSTPIHIYNNTVYDLKNSQAEAIRIVTTLGGPHVIANNILYHAALGITSSGHTVSNNLTTNPSFVNAAGGDFNLQKGSAAIDAGEVLDIVTTDFRGVRRPQGAGYDIGAYEAGDGSNPLPPKNLSAQ